MVKKSPPKTDENSVGFGPGPGKPGQPGQSIPIEDGDGFSIDRCIQKAMRDDFRKDKGYATDKDLISHIIDAKRPGVETYGQASDLLDRLLSKGLLVEIERGGDERRFVLGEQKQEKEEMRNDGHNNNHHLRQY